MEKTIEELLRELKESMTHNIFGDHLWDDSVEAEILARFAALKKEIAYLKVTNGGLQFNNKVLTAQVASLTAACREAERKV